MLIKTKGYKQWYKCKPTWHCHKEALLVSHNKWSTSSACWRPITCSDTKNHTKKRHPAALSNKGTSWRGLFDFKLHYGSLGLHCTGQWNFIVSSMGSYKMEIARHVSLNALCLSESGRKGKMFQRGAVENGGFLLSRSGGRRRQLMLSPGPWQK